MLQINTVYQVGSTGKIVNQIHEALQKKSIDSYVIYGRGAVSTASNVFKTSWDWEGKMQALYGRLTGNFNGGSFLSTQRLINKIKKIQPDIVHLHLLNGNYVNNYILLRYLAKNKYKTILTLHAEVSYTGICEHAFDCVKWQTGCGNCPQIFKKYHSWFWDKTATDWGKKYAIYTTFESLTLVSVSKWLQDRAKCSPMFRNREFLVIGNGVNSEVYKPTDYLYIKEKLDITNEKIILHVTPSFQSEVKGGKYVVQLAESLQNANVKIIIVGFDGNIQNLPSNIIPIPHTHSQQELAAYYTLANITLLTSKLETFSMVCAESLSCGTPVVGFQAGAPETIASPSYSVFVENGNMAELEREVRAWLEKNIAKKEVSQDAHLRYGIDIMQEQYFSLYQKIYKNEV